MTFGIPVRSLPVDTDGVMYLTNLRKWVEERKRLEAERAAEERDNMSSDRIEYPTSVDVLLGKGQPFQTFLGNLRLADQVHQYSNVYLQADRFEKTVISMDLVYKVRESGGRFLKKDEDGTWVLVSDEEARRKVSQSFRNKNNKQPSGEREDFFPIGGAKRPRIEPSTTSS
jgi:hypothetical protein